MLSVKIVKQISLKTYNKYIYLIYYLYFFINYKNNIYNLKQKAQLYIISFQLSINKK